MNARERGRRRFLKSGAALAGLAVGAIRSASGQTVGSEIPKDSYALGQRSRFVKSVRLPIPEGEAPGRSPALLNPLQDQVGIITPASLHHVISHGHDPPDIDPAQHRLLIHGLVDRPLIFTMEELHRLPSVSRIHFIECASNTSGIGGLPRQTKEATAQITHGWSSCSEWTGVLLSLLLKEAGVQKGASWLIAEGAEASKLSKSIPLEKALEDVLVAYGQNGEALRPENGYPLRLVVPGWEGVSNVKWLRRIKVVDHPYMGRMESTIYPNQRPDGKARWFQFEMGPKSVITRPSGGQRLSSRGYYEITGLAWSGGGVIRRVEVSTDGGRTWKDAQLPEPVLRYAYTRFRMDWNWNGEETVLQSRCTDERGQVQPTLAEISRIWGVNPDYWKSTRNYINHFNPIQPWKVNRDGSVQNELLS